MTVSCCLKIIQQIPLQVVHWDVKSYYVNSTTEFWEILPCEWVKVLIFRIVLWEFAILWTSQCFSPLNFQPNLCRYLLSGSSNSHDSVWWSEGTDCITYYGLCWTKQRIAHTPAQEETIHWSSHTWLFQEGFGISDYMVSSKKLSKSRICLNICNPPFSQTFVHA